MVVLPEPFASFDRNPLLFDQPSILQALPRLTDHLHSTTSTKAQIWVKREDVSSGLGLGGNKIRKLEYVVPSVIAEGSDTIITTGGVQSNHMRQVAAVANHLGLKAVLVPQAHAGSESEAFGSSGNVQVNKLLGAEYAEAGETLESVAASIRDMGGKPYIIGSGASAHLHGGLGFARWAFEVAEQEKEKATFFDTIVVPVASGGTLGGMIAGFKLADQPNNATGSARSRRIIGIDTYNKPPGVLEAIILDIAQRTARLIGLGDDAVRASDVILDTRYNTGTHTGWDEQTANGVRLLGKLEGIVSDPIYSGRAIGAVIDMARLGELDANENVLFVHTGGQAALGAFPGIV